MLTKIVLNNFKSFRNRVTIDLAKTDYTMLPQNISDNGILKGCVFVGANSSGKSTILLAVRLLLDLLFLERGINLSVYLCMFSSSIRYSLTYEFIIDGKVIRYSFEVDTGKSILCEKLYLDDRLMLDRTGTSAISFIVDERGISYDERDIGKNTLFLRTLYFNTKISSCPVLMSWMSFPENSVYVNLFNSQVISYSNSSVALADFLESRGCQIINDFFEEHHFEQSIEL